MNFKTLLEELKDISTQNVLYHGTNFLRTIAILHSGFLKPQTYTTSLTKKPEIATSRNRFFTVELKPSYNIKGIFFELYKDRILGSREHRNISIKPVAEFPSFDLEYINVIKNKNEIIKKNYKKIVNIFNSLLQKSGGKDVNFDFNKKIQEKFKIEDKNILNALYLALTDLKNDLLPINKEKEERFYFKDKKNSEKYLPLEEIIKINHGIKVSPDFMKIKIYDKKEFLDDFKSSFYNISNFYKIFGYTPSMYSNKKIIFDLILKTIKNNKDVFEEKSYFFIINSLVEEIKHEL